MHGTRTEMNENSERWADFCQVNKLVIGGALFPHIGCRKRTWKSPEGIIVNQIDHLVFSGRWRSLPEDLDVLRGADVGSDHHLLMAKVRLKIAEVRKEEKWSSVFRGQQVERLGA